MIKVTYHDKNADDLVFGKDQSLIPRMSYNLHSRMEFLIVKCKRKALIDFCNNDSNTLMNLCSNKIMLYRKNEKIILGLIPFFIPYNAGEYFLNQLKNAYVSFYTEQGLFSQDKKIYALYICNKEFFDYGQNKILLSQIAAYR